MDETTIATDEVVQEVEQEAVPQEVAPEEPINYDLAFMEAAASGDMDAFMKLEESLNGAPSNAVEEEGLLGTDESNSPKVPVDKSTTETTTNVEPVVEKPIDQIDPSVVEELRKQLASRDKVISDLETSRSQTPAVAQVPQQVAQTQTQAPTNLELPARPGASYDPAEWSPEDIKSMTSYYKDMEGYNQKQNDTIANLLSGNGGGAIDSRLVAIERQMQGERDKIALERQEMKFWDGVRTFQNGAKEFQTDRDISEIHKDLDSLGDKLARGAGFFPNHQSQSTMQQYEQNKNYILSSYLNGNEEYTKLADTLGIDKPEGLDQYIRIKEIMDYKGTAVSSGRLGATAPLQTAYVDMLSSNGELGKLIEGIALDERSKAYKDKADAINEAQGVVKTPSSQGVGGNSYQANMPSAGGLTDTLIQQGISQDDIEFFLKVNEDPTLLQSADNLNRFAELDSKISI